MLTGHYGADELTRFLAEAETAAGLHHANIIQIYELGETEGAPFLAVPLRQDPPGKSQSPPCLIA